MVSSVNLLATAARLAALAVICYVSYNIRLHAVNEYGRVIHEFDPYFNFRSTEYLVEHGVTEFFNWYDSRSWYPLGRPVGTTIYPGLQLISALIYEVLQRIGIHMSLNDVCVFIPAWFASVTCVATFGIAYEVSRSANAGLAAAAIMAVVPAHIMRSVAGGYDNESIAMAAMCLTFYLWLRSIRSSGSWPMGLLAALAYVFMVAAWGGYVFVLNMIGLHAMFLLLIGRYSSQLHRAYSLFYVIGTIGAIQIPVVGLAPVKSLEQLGPMVVFGIMQLACLMDAHRTAVKESIESFRKYQLKLLVGFVVLLAAVAAVLAPQGYFGPLSSRVRGLFVQHTHTGNPLVDSVAEHQATRDEMYFQFFHHVCYFAPMGFLSLFWNRNDAKAFLFLYSLIALYFSRKMNRLVLLLSPAASVLGGLAISGILEWCFGQALDFLQSLNEKPNKADKNAKDEKGDKNKKKDKKRPSPAAAGKDEFFGLSSFAPIVTMQTAAREFSQQYPSVRHVAAGLAVVVLYSSGSRFWRHCNGMAYALSNPSIILKGQSNDGRTVYLDDFREAYWWLRDNTPEDSRILSWWDYGYQIASIANRTTLADGNTWNHEHIALLGKILVSPVKESHEIARHLADYVLVWSTRFVGNQGDDIAKSPHMARIGGSVYKDINPNLFYYDHQGRPSKMVAESLVYNLVLNTFDPTVGPLPEGTYVEAHTSPNRMVRIYKVLNVSKASKRYCAENRGYQAWKAGTPLISAYPPKLQSVLSKKEDFAQLEDFNKRREREQAKK